MTTLLTQKLKKYADRVVPDPFVLSLILSILVYIWAAFKFSGDLGFASAVSKTSKAWFSGFSSKGGLAFALQICFVLVTGHALALSPPVQKLVAGLAKLPKDAKSASALVAFFSGLAAIFHWGLGAIAGALLAREIGRHKKGVHYPILGAAAYSGMALWHGGLSGSAPLKIAEPTNFAAKISGAIPLSDTLFSGLNFTITGSLLILIPILFYIFTPESPEYSEQAGAFLKDVEDSGENQSADNSDQSIFVWIQNSKFVAWLFGGFGLFAVIYALSIKGMNFDLNTVNLIFLFLGILLQSSLIRYVKAISEGAGGAGGIILQFPFYFGILGMMKGSRIIGDISQFFLSISQIQT